MLLPRKRNTRERELKKNNNKTALGSLMSVDWCCPYVIW